MVRRWYEDGKVEEEEEDGEEKDEEDEEEGEGKDEEGRCSVDLNKR